MNKNFANIREIRKKLIIIYLLLMSLVFLSCADFYSSSKVEPENQPVSYYEHKVQFPGETLSIIASWYTGRADNWPRIRDANPGLRPEAMRIGQFVYIPRHLVVNDRPLTQDAVRKARGTTEQRQPTRHLTEEKSEVHEPIKEIVEPKPEVPENPVAEETIQTQDTHIGEVGAGGWNQGLEEATSDAVEPEPDSGSVDVLEPDDAERERLLRELLGD
jgi:hypothetical protein